MAIRVFRSAGLTGLTEPDRVLAATVEAIHRHGCVEVRASLRGIHRKYPPLDLVAAVDAGPGEGLDAAIFWRLATGPAVSERALVNSWREQGAGPREANERRAGLPPFAERLRLPDDPEVGALVVPWGAGNAPGKVRFPRAPPRHCCGPNPRPVLLSVPTWRDGTLGVEDLLRRLDVVARGSGVVGPIDLVQALHRLREVDARLVDDVPERDPGPTRSSPTLDGRKSWDATDLVQKWLRFGRSAGARAVGPGRRWIGTARSRCRSPALPRGRPSWLTTRGHPDRCRRRCGATRAGRIGSFEDAFSVVVALRSPAPSQPRRRATRRAVPRPVARVAHDRAQPRPLPGFGDVGAARTVGEGSTPPRLPPPPVVVTRQGRSSLTLLVRTLQRDFEVALRGLWPTALAIGDALCTVAKRPPQLAELLRLLAGVAHEVPASVQPSVPQGLSALAESKGTTKAHEAARQLVAALRLAGAS